MIESLTSDQTGSRQKPKPGFAPLYCALYPELATEVRKYGYALAVHGSLTRDFDLIAVPWTDDASDPEEVIEFLTNTNTFALNRIGTLTPHKHGRMVQTLGISFGECFLDLSFMPRSITK